MAYRLKTVRYQNADCKILLQNENGPCPLLAAANALLLKRVISLPSQCIRNGVASLDDVVNVLAERALAAESHEHHLNELLTLFPKLHDGMDVNPKFTAGPTGVEYTTGLTAFDLLNVELVHGWLLDPQDQHTVALVGSKTYNELVEIVVKGNDASTELQTIPSTIQKTKAELERLRKEDEEWVDVAANEGSPANEVEGGYVQADADEIPRPSTVGGMDDLSASPAVEATSNTDDEPATPTAVNNSNTTDTPSSSATESPSNVKDSPASLATEPDSNAAPALLTAESSSKTDEATATPAEPVNSNTDEAIMESTEPVQLSKIEQEQMLQETLQKLQSRNEELEILATNGSLVSSFLTSTSHQLTHYGLHQLYEYLADESLSVFFRNNHFATLTKHKGVLYLLVTDLGYANVPEVMWEKLDGIDGDTEYVNSLFLTPAPQAQLAPARGPTLSPEEMLAQRGQSDADYQLALQLSKNTAVNNLDEEEGRLLAAASEASLREYHGIAEEETKTEEMPLDSYHGILVPSTGLVDGCSTQEDSDKLIAMQLQEDMEREDASIQLARELQQQENRMARTGPVRRNNNSSSTATSSSGSGCVIS